MGVYRDVERRSGRYFLNGKFNIGAEWYWKKTTDMLIEAQYSAFANPEIKKPYINFGDIKNTGVDLT